MEPSTIILAILLTSVSVIPAIAFSSELTAWLKKKYLQYEVTFAIFMMTPREKFLFNSFVFLSFSMLLIAASLYLPEHVVTMSQRAFYYWSGYTHSSSPSSFSTSAAAAAVRRTAAEVAATLSEGAKTGLVGAVGQGQGAAAQTPVEVVPIVGL